jgi:acetyl-CoA carboxylase carboxyl transferase subunit beta
MASYASLGDVIIAEPRALLGFAGPRVIQQTIKQDLPPGFQSSEFFLEHGFLDIISHRKDLKRNISLILQYLS